MNLYPAAVRTVLERGLRGDDARFDDAVQEGVIAGWLAVQTPRREPATYARVAMRRRITDILSGRRRPIGGAEGTKVYDLHAQHTRRADFADAEATPAPDTLSPLELRGPLARALACLDDADRHIALGVARGDSWAELGADLDAYSWAVEAAWSTRIRPHLRTALAHLADAA